MTNPFQLCLFCGGNAAEPNHTEQCDGRQGRVEARALLTPGLAMVRVPDCQTSIQAAEAMLPHLSDLQERLYAAFVKYGPMTDEQAERLQEFTTCGYSTIRKRRTDLYHMGRLMPVGVTVNSRGRNMTVWSTVQ